MITDQKLLRNKEMKDAFVELRTIPKQYTAPHNGNDAPFGYIYCIENKINHKKYIGSVYSQWQGVLHPHPMSQIYKRATNYIYEYNKTLREREESGKPNTFTRPIIQAMVDEGISNFVMYPIAETTMTTHKAAENFFIQHFDTIAKGYNTDMSAIRTDKRGKAHTAEGKLLRSEGIVAVNVNMKQLILADSLKLFGDYMNSSKDMIKNAARKGRPYKGWFVFYCEPGKRLEVLEKNVRGDGLPVDDRHSKKSQLFYEKLCGTVSLYLQNDCNNEYFPGFKRLPSLEYKND